MIECFNNLKDSDINDWNHKKDINALLNIPGRIPLLGSITGLVRVIMSVAAIAFHFITAAFSLSAAIIIAPYTLVCCLMGKDDVLVRAPLTFLKVAIESVAATPYHIQKLARGIIEAVPFMGTALMYYDLRQYENIRNPGFSDPNAAY